MWGELYPVLFWNLFNSAKLPSMHNPGSSLPHKGQQLVSALENSVSQYPTLEGRFAQLAGVRFSFDAGESPGQRINPEGVEVQGTPLDLEQVKHSAGKVPFF